jgi:hypothetical protein
VGTTSIVIENACVLGAKRSLSAVTAPEYAPDALGVPLSVPFAGSRLRPGGRDPELTPNRAAGVAVAV